MIHEVVFDIEADGFTPTKIHVVSAGFNGGKINSTDDYDRMRKLLSREDITLIGHNIIRFDIPVLERLLGISIKAKLIDTLALSWYLYPNRSRHGLAYWGEEFGVPKPKVDDWVGLTYEEYEHRCSEDVRINTLLWHKMKDYLIRIYGSYEEAQKLIDYLMFKMDCAREQERSKWKLDVQGSETLETELSGEYEKAIETLRGVMPNVPIKVTKTRPAKPYKKDGSLSAIGEKWFKILEDNHKHPDTKLITYLDGDNPPNPASDPQLKSWLYSLGWVPCTFKYKRDKETNEVKTIPQVRMKDENNQPIFTPSVEELIDVVPELDALRRVGVVKHRLDVVRGFLRNVDEEGFLQAKIKGFTNTLRFKHEVFVNIPAVDKPYGEALRGLLTCRDGYILCGSDQCALEDRTKHHYLWDFDPEYVTSLSSPDYDAHLDMALVAGMITKEDITFFKNATPEEKHGERYKKIAAQRKKGKATNYSSVYGAGGATIARAANVSEKEGKLLHTAYWKLNWAVKAIAESRIVKDVDGQLWMYNDVSHLWYTLRHDKDRFSTTNQGTGTYCFDTWVKKIRSKRPQLTGQAHDEVILEIKKGAEEQCTKLLKWAIQEVNKDLKLNRDLDVDVSYGNNYSKIH